MSRIITLVLLLLGSFMRGQDTLSIIGGEYIESIIQSDEPSGDLTNTMLHLKHLLSRPLDLNDLSAEELYDLPFLNEIQVSDILTHKDRFGKYLSKYELQSIPSLDMETLRKLLPFVDVGSSRRTNDLSTLWKYAKHEIFLRGSRSLQRRQGFKKSASEGGYLGDPSHLFLRYHGHTEQKLRLGFTMEKDAGEKVFTTDHGIEFLSGYVYARDLTSFLRDIIIGDYSIGMGQGLIMHNSFGGSKSSLVMNIKKGGRPIKPFSSVNENAYLRGAASRLALGKISTTLFASRKSLDANPIIDTTSTTPYSEFSTLDRSGYHRSEKELSRRKQVRATHVGGSLRYDIHPRVSLSANVLHTAFDKYWRPREEPYRRYSFSGNKLLNASIDYSIRYKNLSFFGETALSGNRGMAHIHGLLTTLSRNTDLSLVYRRYDKDYQVLEANAFAESSQPVNEEGIYSSIRITPASGWTVSGYMDIWRHPYLRYQKDAPSAGREYLLRIDHYKKRTYRTYVQYRYEQKEENARTLDSRRKTILPSKQHRLRMHLEYGIGRGLTLRHRLEYVHYTRRPKTSSGYLLYQDIIYKSIEHPLSFTARYAIFDTDDFDSRIYAYENNVLYVFSIPFYYGRGSRMYVNARYRMTPWLVGEVRYASTWYSDVTHTPRYSGISSSNQKINGDRHDQIVVQFKITL